MRTSIRKVVDPQDYEPKDLLRLIENDPESFTAGRRNNDMVNWFITKRIVDLENRFEAGLTAYDINRRYLEDFKEMMSGLNAVQLNALSDWETTWTNKIGTLVDHYHGYRDIWNLYHLWLPIDYAVSTEMENQLQLMTEG